MAVELLGGAEKNPSADGHTVPYACTRWPTKSRVFAPVFDELACSYKNEGSIPFTRSNPLFLGFRWIPGFSANTSANKSSGIQPRPLTSTDSFWPWLGWPDTKASQAVCVDSVQLIQASTGLLVG